MFVFLSIKFRENSPETYTMTSTIHLTLHLLNLKSQSFEMAEKAGFEALKTGSALLKKEHLRKGGAAGGDKVLRGHRKNANRYAQVLKTVRET